ncbi:hypothetical protein HPP92_008617, partial [Vanilla planifolia]
MLTTLRTAVESSLQGVSSLQRRCQEREEGRSPSGKSSDCSCGNCFRSVRNLALG